MVTQEKKSLGCDESPGGSFNTIIIIVNNQALFINHYFPSVPGSCVLWTYLSAGEFLQALPEHSLYPTALPLHSLLSCAYPGRYSG